ncbi:cation transporter [Halosquirtibacter xylanolyticus]|uniref:cation transporter n=1 Tax=Halosquirtibacter xylanolyticus TaxID=3374599 RepID=UPI0037479D41|nr:cation transporter [Prolixibacteraceae bacterium]
MSEKKIIWISIVSAIAFSLVGIIWGTISGSAMIIFDGVYSFVSVILSLLSLIVANSLNKEGTSEHFPVGKAHLEPFLIVFKSLVLITTCIYSISNGIVDIMSGGHLVNPTQTITYSVISTIGCWSTLHYIRKKNKAIQSNIVQIEGDQWYGDTLLSIGVLVGFGISELLGLLGFNQVLYYVDSTLVILASSFFILIPVKSLWIHGKEMMLLAPHKKYVTPFVKVANQLCEELNADDYDISVVKQGQELYVECTFSFLRDQTFSLSEIDDIKHRIQTPFQKKYNVVVVLDLIISTPKLNQ